MAVALVRAEGPPQNALHIRRPPGKWPGGLEAERPPRALQLVSGTACAVAYSIFVFWTRRSTGRAVAAALSAAAAAGTAPAAVTARAPTAAARGGRGVVSRRRIVGRSAAAGTSP